MKILFMGTPSFAVPTLEELAKDYEIVGVVCQPDKPAGRGKKLTPPPVKVTAQRLGLRVFQPERIKTFIETLKDLKSDLIVVVAYGKILPKEIIYSPPYKTLNLHASLLPKYRGASPIHRALIAGERETGNTVMLVTEKMDAGDILAQEKVAIEEEDNLFTLSEKLSKKGAKLLSRTIPLWVEGKIKPIPQREELATYAPPVQKEEMRICWKADAESVRNRIRGLYPNAFTFFRGQRIKILKASLTDGEGQPGEVLNGADLIVAYGKGALKVEELISPKGKRMSGKDFCRGYRPKEGELFG